LTSARSQHVKRFAYACNTESRFNVLCNNFGDGEWEVKDEVYIMGHHLFFEVIC